MKEYGLSYGDLMESSYEWYMEATKILALESKEEKRRSEEMESKASGVR